MKNNLKKFFIIMVAIVTIFSFSTTTLAYNLLGTGKISGGAKNILYWRDSSAYEYRHSIDYGIQYWNGHSSKVSVARTSTQSYSRADCYWDDYFPTGVIAGTQFYLNNQVTTNYNVDWYWCKIFFDSDLYCYSGLTYFHRKGTACHEYGHFLGLDHTNSTPSNIMHQYCVYGVYRTAGSPSTDDVNGIKAIYGD